MWPFSEIQIAVLEPDYPKDLSRHRYWSDATPWEVQSKRKRNGSYVPGGQTLKGLRHWVDDGDVVHLNSEAPKWSNKKGTMYTCEYAILFGRTNDPNTPPLLSLHYLDT